MADDEAKRTEDHCPHCHVRRSGYYNLRTGRGVVTTALSCPHRGKCEQEILPGIVLDDAYALGPAASKITPR